jgi:hypothetical protein
VFTIGEQRFLDHASQPQVLSVPSVLPQQVDDGVGVGLSDAVETTYVSLSFCVKEIPLQEDGFRIVEMRPQFGAACSMIDCGSL